MMTMMTSMTSVLHSLARRPARRFASLAGMVTLVVMGCAAPPPSVELRAGAQYTRLTGVVAERGGEDIDLGDRKLTAVPLTGLQLHVDVVEGDPRDLAAVLNACEADRARCELTVYSHKDKVLAQWSFGNTAVTERTRKDVQRLITRARAGLSNDKPVGPLTVKFEIVSLYPAKK